MKQGYNLSDECKDSPGFHPGFSSREGKHGIFQIEEGGQYVYSSIRSFAQDTLKRESYSTITTWTKRVGVWWSPQVNLCVLS